jgi:hypothetical protein
VTPVITRGVTPGPTPVVDPVEPGGSEPDLIDRIAAALPEEVRAEYYRELLHCRSLPQDDEMLRLLRAMQFLVLLIEQAPSRIAEERERLDKLLAATIANMTKISAASETYHTSLQRKITRLPADIASGISPDAIAAKINENLRQEFIKSTIPKTAQALAVISDQMKTVCSDFSTTADTLGSEYRGAAEDARKVIASLHSEMSEATVTAGRFTAELNQKFTKAYRLSLMMLGGGAAIIGLAMGMMFERFLFLPPDRAVQPQAPVVQTAPQASPQPAPQTAREAPWAASKANSAK